MCNCRGILEVSFPTLPSIFVAVSRFVSPQANTRTVSDFCLQKNTRNLQPTELSIETRTCLSSRIKKRSAFSHRSKMSHPKTGVSKLSKGTKWCPSVFFRCSLHFRSWWNRSQSIEILSRGVYKFDGFLNRGLQQKPAAKKTTTAGSAMGPFPILMVAGSVFFFVSLAFLVRRSFAFYEFTIEATIQYMGTPKSSILIRFSIIFTIHFGGKIPLFLVQHPYSWIF